MENDAALCAMFQRRGDRIADRYVLADLIGIGGMGVVYSAVHATSGDTVAIKVPRPELADDEYVRRRFHAEALAGARIDHPNVVQVLESGASEGHPYLVMEHLTGRLLGDVARERGPIPPEEALLLVGQLLAALATMHRHGVVHGDVKPENAVLVVDRSGHCTLKLIDLGLARFTDDRGESVSDGLVAGTPEYLAPELSHGDSPSTASDQYAACISIYELLAGVVPFGGATAAEITAGHLEGELVPLATRCPGLPHAVKLDRVLRRGLSKRPRDRFRDIASLAAALRAAVPTAGMTMWVVPDGTTADWIVAPGPRCARSRDGAQVAVRRQALASAVASGQIEQIVDQSFELVRALVDDHRLAGAIGELELLLALLDGQEQRAYAQARWRVELALAALYNGQGNNRRSRRLAQAARDHAKKCGNAVGVLRAAALLARLAHARERITRVGVDEPER